MPLLFFYFETSSSMEVIVHLSDNLELPQVRMITATLVVKFGTAEDRDGFPTET